MFRVGVAQKLQTDHGYVNERAGSGLCAAGRPSGAFSLSGTRLQRCVDGDTVLKSHGFSRGATPIIFIL
jgi:hypothetical protein